MIPITDTHAHVYMRYKSDDKSSIAISEIKDIASRSLSSGVHRVLLPSVDSHSISDLLKCVKVDNNIFYPMVGLHPCYVKKDFEQELYKLEKYLSLNNIVAIGECGIDFYHSNNFLEQQKEAFQIQARWSHEKGLPIVIHCRSGFDYLMKWIEELPFKLNGVMHCFTGSIDELNIVLRYGFYISVGGIITFKNSSILPMAKSIPMDKVLLETDTPYLAPHPHRGKKNEPSYVKYVASFLANLYGISYDEFATQTEKNVNKLFFPHL